MDEATKYKSTFVTAKTMGVTYLESTCLKYSNL